ncbi:hypothetical protein BJ912DRAFT_1115423 [Pholiota molesta]|nr:hypothetical protein BJ912DRAFT_1115423 [Pholiota molesta]
MVAMYELDDTATFGKEIYTNLRSQRSEREKGVMQRLETLTRITGEDLGVYGQKEGEENTGMKLDKPSECVITHSLAVSEWAAKIASRAAETIPGWVRVRVVKVLESGKLVWGPLLRLSLKQMKNRDDTQIDDRAPEHRKITINALHSIVFGSSEQKADHWRSWKLYKAYPCVAQGISPRCKRSSEKSAKVDQYQRSEYSS